MNHPYTNHIEKQAENYYSRQDHEPHCETLQPYRVPRNERTGETYDVYVIQHCDCWLTINYTELTLSRKLEAMRALSHRFGLHSPSCGRYRRTPIMYRNKPEVMTGWCDCWLSIDMRPDSPVEYNETEEQRKEPTVSDLSRAVKLAETFEQSQLDINNFLEPFAKDYAAFLTRDTKGYNRLRNFALDTFLNVEAKNFYIQGDETYAQGEYDTPYLTLPFAFVEDPAQYKADVLAKQAEARAKADAKKAKDKSERVERLKLQLAKAQAELDKALADGDEIKTTATINQIEIMKVDD